MQPRIVYALRAIENAGSAEGVILPEISDIHEIRILPFSNPGPPLDTEDFPGDFHEVSSRSPKQALWNRSLGQMSVSMKEPSPLNLVRRTPKASTNCVIKLSLKPFDAFARTIRPENWSLLVESCLHVKTFYSTQPLRGMPSLRPRKKFPDLRHRSAFMVLESRRYSLLSWRLNWLTKNGTISQDPQPSWTTTIDLPVSVPKSLTPTFLSRLAARTYALKMKVRVLGINHDPFELEVPVQVIYQGSTRTGQPQVELTEEHLNDTRNSVSPPAIPDFSMPEECPV